MSASRPLKHICAVALFLVATGACLVVLRVASVASAQVPLKTALPPDSSFSPRDFMIQRDGKLLAAGSLDHYERTGQSPGTKTAFAIARYKTDGTLDPTFGDGGFSVVDKNGGAVCLVSGSKGPI